MDVDLGMAQRHRDKLEHLLNTRVDATEVREARRGGRIVFCNGPTRKLYAFVAAVLCEAGRAGLALPT